MHDRIRNALIPRKLARSTEKVFPLAVPLVLPLLPVGAEFGRVPGWVSEDAGKGTLADVVVVAKSGTCGTFEVELTEVVEETLARLLRQLKDPTRTRGHRRSGAGERGGTPASRE